MKKILFALLAATMLIGCQEKKEEFIIDLVFPLTGNGAAASKATTNAIQMCVNKWNNNGGFKGKHIVVQHHDSKGQAKEGVIIAKKISINNPDLVVSAMSPVSLSMLPILEKNNILHLAFSGAQTLFETNPKHVIRGSISPSQIGHNIIRLFNEHYPQRNLVIFYCMDDFGQGYMNATLDAAQAMNINELRTIAYENNALSYRELILKSDISNDDVLFIIGLQGSLGKLIKQVRETGFEGTILCETNITSASTLALLSPSHLQNLYYLSMTMDEHLAKPIFTQYYELFGDYPSELALDAYNNIDVILQILQETDLSNISQFIPHLNMHIDGLFGPTSIINYEIQYNLQLKDGRELL